jgi:hypothetical protein
MSLLNSIRRRGGFKSSSEEGADAGQARVAASGTAWTPLQITRPHRSPGPAAFTAKTRKLGLEITAVTCAHARPRWWRTVTGAAGSRASVRDRSRTPAARWAGSARAREAGWPVPARLAARVALWGFNSGFMGVQLGCEVILGYFTEPGAPARRMLPGASWEMLHDLPGQGRAARRRGEPTPAARIAGPLSWAFTSQAERHAAKSSRNSPVIIPVLVTFIG